MLHELTGLPSAISASTISCVWNGGNSQSLVKLIISQRHLRRAEGGGQFLFRVAQVEQVDGHRQREVAVRIEPFAEPVALVGEVGADGEFRFELGLHCARMEAFGVEFLRHRFAREVGDVPEHPRDGQPDQRALALVVILAVAVFGIGEDGVSADDVEGQGLARQSRRSGERDGAGDAVGISRGPGERGMPAERSAHDGAELGDAQMLDQPPLGFDDIADRDDGKIGAVAAAGFGIDAVRPGAAAASAQAVRADDEVAVGVDALARPDQNIPPAGIVRVVVPGDVRIAGERMADQHGVVAPCVQAAVGLDRPRSPAATARRAPNRAARKR